MKGLNKKMKRKDIDVFKLTHTYDEGDSNIYIKADMKELDLVKLIKVWQIKGFYLDETYDIEIEDMRDILIQYDNIRAYPNEDDLKELEQKSEDGFDFIDENFSTEYGERGDMKS
jgi:hypothetical protein